MAQKTSVDPVPQEITVLTGEAVQRIQDAGAKGADFVGAYLREVGEPDLNAYDRAFQAWQSSSSPKHTEEEVVEILGAYLGNKFVVDFEMEWVTVTDSYGTDYAVRGEKSSVTGFPFSTVQKRIDEKSYDFMYNVYHTLKHLLESGEYK